MGELSEKHTKYITNDWVKKKGNALDCCGFQWSTLRKMKELNPSNELFIPTSKYSNNQCTTDGILSP